MKPQTMLFGTLHRIVVLFVFSQFNCTLTDPAGGENGDISLVSCVITHTSWIKPDRIIIQWQWRNLPNTTDWSAAWYSDFNMGQCSQSTLTSCMCRYGDGNCMDFDTFFEIIVTVDKHKHSLPIDPETCLKPPKLDSVSVVPINSTCIETTWYYETTGATLCSELSDLKEYQITYRDKESTLHRFVVLDNVKSCNGSYILCGLVPYTQYEVGVSCKFTDYLKRAVGHWSDPAENTCTTLQSLPSGAPNMSFGGFSHIVENCEKDRRTMRVYWQPVDPWKRNGIIISYHIHVFSYHNISTILQSEKRPEETIHVDLELKCSQKYAIRLSAATTVGVSSVFSKIDIPSRGLDDGPDVLEVIPVVSRNRSWNVTWKLNSSDSGTISRTVVFWCLKSLSGDCKKSLEWRTVPSNSTSLSVSPSPRQPLHHFMVGISAGSRGITWTTCQFAGNKVPTRPAGVRVVQVGGSLSILWENSPCESRLFGPYIDHFKIYTCPVLTDKDRNCSGNSTSIEVDNESSSYLWSDLDSNIIYKINLVAIGRENTTSPPSNDVYGTATARSNALSNDQILMAIFVPLSIVILIGVPAICIKAYRRLRRRGEKQAEVLLPTTLLGQMPDDTVKLSENHETPI